MQGLSLDLRLQCVSTAVESAGAMYFDFTNVLNHMQPNDPALNIFSPGSRAGGLPRSSRVRIAWPPDFGMYTGTRFSTAVPSSNGANYDPRGSSIGASTWSEPWDRQP